MEVPQHDHMLHTQLKHLMAFGRRQTPNRAPILPRYAPQRRLPTPRSATLIQFRFSAGNRRSEKHGTTLTTGYSSL